ncbi:uncharacterized protein [Drosophila kikkawai]|uniref:CCHC-type domain-containing protein n=1 Tax=Drosophila kikkawai TaxID=30033 RepID=A0ABM4GHU1_DROKI
MRVFMRQTHLEFQSLAAGFKELSTRFQKAEHHFKSLKLLNPECPLMQFTPRAKPAAVDNGSGDDASSITTSMVEDLVRPLDQQPVNVVQASTAGTPRRWAEPWVKLYAAPKRTRDPASPTSSQRTTPAKKSKASEEAASLQDLQELGKLLQEVSTKMMDKTTRHITVSTRELFAKMKALHASILAASRAAAAGNKERQECDVGTSLCPKCAQSTRSADKEQQTATVGKKEATAQTEPWRRLSQPNWPELPAPVPAPKPAGATQQGSEKGPRKPRKKTQGAHAEPAEAHTATRILENPAKPTGEWRVVAKKPRAARRGRPDAVIVQANGKSYSEVLAMVTRRDDKQLSDLGACVSKVRRTNNGNLLLEVAKGSAESAEEMKESIERVLGDSATVRASTEDTKVLVLEVRNIDSITSKKEVCAAIAGQFNFEAERVRVRSMRSGRAETQLAVVSLPVPLGKAVLQRGEVRIGWSTCRIRERTGPPRCFRCLETGHIAIHCKNPVDRSVCCIKCGEMGHKAADCSKEPSCLLAAQDLLLQTVSEVAADVAILSEPYKAREGGAWAKDRSGKAALWLYGDGQRRMSNILSADGFVRAEVSGFCIYSCYLAPSLPLDAFSRILDNLCSDMRGRAKVVVGGDFNAWALEWGSVSTNARGRAVMEAFASTDVVLLSDGMRHTFARAGAASIIDLTFVSSAISHDANWEVSDAYTGSDHEAILCTVGAPEGNTRTLPRPRRAYRPDTLRTQAFANALDGLSAEALGEANEAANQIAAALEHACDQSMRLRGTCRRNQRPTFWWSDEIADLRSKCLHARRQMTRARGSSRLVECSEAYKSARRALKLAIREAKRECFLRLCDEAENDPWGGAYRLVVKGLKAGSTAPSDPEALDSIALFPRGAPVVLTQSSAERHPNVDCEVSEGEVIRTGRSVRPKKAPGPDAVPNRALKLAIALHPKEPICLTDTTGKVFEKVIAARLNAAIERAGGLSPSQFGFRKGRSTLDAIEMVKEIAETAIAGTRWKGGSKNYCLVITLDIRNAFNTADWNRTLESLAALNIPGYLMEIARSYFSERVLIVDTDVGSRAYEVSAGVP